jgi:hypothetical protein
MPDTTQQEHCDLFLMGHLMHSFNQTEMHTFLLTNYKEKGRGRVKIFPCSHPDDGKCTRKSSNGNLSTRNMF